MLLQKSLDLLTCDNGTFISELVNLLTSKDYLIFLASDFPTCYRNDPELNKCLLNATIQVQPYLGELFSIHYIKLVILFIPL